MCRFSFSKKWNDCRSYFRENFIKPIEHRTRDSKLFFISGPEKLKWVPQLALRIGILTRSSHSETFNFFWYTIRPCAELSLFDKKYLNVPSVKKYVRFFFLFSNLWEPQIFSLTKWAHFLLHFHFFSAFECGALRQLSLSAQK